MKKNYSGEPSNLVRYHQIQRNLQLHDKRILNAQPTLRCKGHLSSANITHVKKQPLAQFNRIVTMNIENKALLNKLTNPPSNNIGKEKPYKLIKNNRKKNFEEYKQRLENQGLSKRIRQAKSSYKAQRYASQRKANQHYLNTISKFGYKDFKPNKTLLWGLNCRKNQSQSPQKESQLNQDKQNHRNFAKRVSQRQFECKKLKKILGVIDKKNVKINGKWVKISGVIWSTEVSLQLETRKGDIFILETPKSFFQNKCQGSIDQLIKNISYNSQQEYFSLELVK